MIKDFAAPKIVNTPQMGYSKPFCHQLIDQEHNVIHVVFSNGTTKLEEIAAIVASGRNVDATKPEEIGACVEIAYQLLLACGQFNAMLVKQEATAGSKADPAPPASALLL